MAGTLSGHSVDWRVPEVLVQEGDDTPEGINRSRRGERDQGAQHKNANH